MKLFDLLIIYLACGAPFGVYYFFDNRNRQAPAGTSLIYSLLTFVFWIPFALGLLLQNKSLQNVSAKRFAETPRSDSEINKKIAYFQKQFEKILIESGLNISIYAFREIFERYAGLTLAAFEEQPLVAKDHQIFRVSGNTDPGLSTICLARRNRQRLFFHQTGARRDFLTVFENLFELSADQKKLGNLAVQFVKLLNDAGAAAALTKKINAFQQTEEEFTVRQAERELWITDLPKPIHAKLESAPLKTMTVTANLRRKD